MSQYDPPRPPGQRPDDGAWISPSTSSGVPPATRGVVFSAASGGQPPGPYDGLREIPDGEPLWPLEDPSQPPATPPRSNIPPFLIGLLVGVTLAAISVAVFQIFSTRDETPAAAPSTVPVTASTAPPTTTVTTTPPETTVTTAPPETTVTTAPPPIEPVGTPLDVADLRMAADGIGPVKIGSLSSEALGQLVVSLGPPDEDTGVVTSDGAFGACVGDQVRLVRWGPLMTVNVLDTNGNVVFSAYRLDFALGGLDSRASTLATLSGLRAGDTVAELNTIYNDFTIEYFDEPEVGLMFELQRLGEAQVLLRGPITSNEDTGVVTGIWSPDACAGA